MLYFPDMNAHIGIIGGSGLYEIEGLTNATELRVETPWGPPSDGIVRGELAGRSVFFLPRHGRGHRILPHDINHRANLYALRSLGVRWIIAVSAVGSLQPQYAPRHIVLPDQFYDRTSRRADHTFFGGGIVAHIAFADPTSAPLRALLAEAARETGAVVHNGGTYVNMDGPAFSTRAESETNRRLGFDVIGMTNLPLHDHRLRLLEGRRGTGHRPNRDQPPATQRRDRKDDPRARDPAPADRAGLARAFRLGQRLRHRQSPLAACHRAKTGRPA